MEAGVAEQENPPFKTRNSGAALGKTTSTELLKGNEASLEGNTRKEHAQRAPEYSSALQA